MKDQGQLGVDVIINDIQSNPRCTHGPTVLFERFQNNGTSRKYYACSACRDRRDCSYYHLADQKISQAKEEVWQSLIKEATPKWSHKDIYNRLKVIKAYPDSKRTYCCTCSLLLGDKRKDQHKSCVVKSPITDEQLCKPSSFLPPKESSRFEAQYMFATPSVEIIMGMLEQIGAKKVLCIGTPRIFEAITASPEKKMSALLMDIDDRYGVFFSPMEYLCYNMFNHHFFGGEEAKQIYQQFISGGEKLVVISDPPFGGRMELLGHNLLTIQNDWRTANKLSKKKELSVLFVFPYFMEPQVLEKLPNFTMLDYQVDYDNHPLYSSGVKGMIHGSAVRVYVNDRPSLFVLPESKGYRLCKLCDRWVRSTNIHCEKCNGCMSKDGRTYKHCDECSKCVKPSWVHCSSCQKCQQQDHKCDGTSDGSAKSVTCHICGQQGHKRMDCPGRKRSLSESSSDMKSNKKRKLEHKVETMNAVGNVVLSKYNTNKNKKKNKNKNVNANMNGTKTTPEKKNKKKKQNINVGTNMNATKTTPEKKVKKKNKNKNVVTNMNATKTTPEKKVNIGQNTMGMKNKFENENKNKNKNTDGKQIAVQKMNVIESKKKNSSEKPSKKNKKNAGIMENEEQAIKENMLKKKNKGKKNKKGKKNLQSPSGKGGGI